MSTYRIYFCHHHSCKYYGAQAVWVKLKQAIQEQNLQERCSLMVSGGQGRCESGPNITVHPGAVKYGSLTPEDIQRIVDEHIAADQIVEDLRWKGW